MSLFVILLSFGFTHSFALLSKNFQTVVNEKLMPSDLLKIKTTDPNWRGEEPFKSISKVVRLFVHKETDEIVFEAKEKLWTGDENLLNGGENEDWNPLFFELPREHHQHSAQNWAEALAHVIDLHAKRECETTPLMRAMERNYGTKVGWILLARGADVNEKGAHGETAVHWAAIARHHITDALDLLLMFQADVNVTDKDKETPLMKAIQATNYDAVELLLARGADLNIKNNQGKTALDIAKHNMNKCQPIIDLLQMYMH